jgi:hypothetical protein
VIVFLLLLTPSPACCSSSSCSSLAASAWPIILRRSRSSDIPIRDRVFCAYTLLFSSLSEQRYLSILILPLSPLNILGFFYEITKAGLCAPLAQRQPSRSGLVLPAEAGFCRALVLAWRFSGLCPGSRRLEQEIRGVSRQTHVVTSKLSKWWQCPRLSDVTLNRAQRHRSFGPNEAGNHFSDS